MVASSGDSVPRKFGFAGGGGFLIFDVPAHATNKQISVHDTVKAGSVTNFEHRGSGTVGVVSLTSICMQKAIRTPLD